MLVRRSALLGWMLLMVVCASSLLRPTHALPMDAASSVQNWWIIVPNTLGLAIATFYTTATYHLLKPAEKVGVVKTFALV